jgi:hypothetical protein
MRSLKSTLKMHEHRLYAIEKWEGGKIVERHMLLCTPKDAIMYALRGYTVFDFHESLDMEPEFYENTTTIHYS